MEAMRTSSEFLYLRQQTNGKIILKQRNSYSVGRSYYKQHHVDQ